MSFPIANVASPVLSPSLNEYGEAIYLDEHGNELELFAVASLDANGNASLPTGTGVVAPGHISQVTNRRQSAIVKTPSGTKIRIQALVSLDSSGNPVPFVPAAAKSVSGKFQSVVETGTGSSQNIAHGLGVVPSLVLVAPYDNTASGSTPFTFQIAEGAHDATNLKITATSGLLYKVIAFA